MRRPSFLAYFGGLNVPKLLTTNPAKLSTTMCFQNCA